MNEGKGNHVRAASRRDRHEVHKGKKVLEKFCVSFKLEYLSKIFSFVFIRVYLRLGIVVKVGNAHFTNYSAFAISVTRPCEP